MTTRRCAVVIVGSGPGGAATALALAQRSPRLAAEAVMLERARHPRDKTCAGGIIPKAEALLAELGVPFDVPNVPVDVARVRVPGRTLTIDGGGLCRVVRRREFDARLAWAARERGVELHEDARVVALARDGDGVRVETPTGSYWAPVVVGADGSGSLVRRSLVGDATAPIGRAVMCDIPVTATVWDGVSARRYDFDFDPCANGLRGYRWVFPCLIDGVPHANVGVYGLPSIDGARLVAELDGTAAGIGATASRRHAFPIRTLGRATRVAAPHALLVGDAAGVDPLMGEGISFALEYGRLAAHAIVEAHERRRWDLASYERAVHRGPIGRKLRVLRAVTSVFYGPVGSAAFALVARSRRAQRFGLRWYNGVGGLDEVPLIPLLTRGFVRAALTPRRGAC